MKWELGSDCAVVHLTLVPYLKSAGELKTKPTQHSVKTLLEQGVQPDIIVCRTERHLSDGIRKKIAQFCNVTPSSVVESIDASTIYEVPLLMKEEKLDVEVLKKTNTEIPEKVDLVNWTRFITNVKNPKKEVTVALVGKYVELKDAYKSINEAFIHGGASNEAKVNVRYVKAESLTGADCEDKFKDVDGILVAPGFGSRGIEGKIVAIRYARENKIPFLGICLGMQCAVIEYARNVLGYEGAHSTEMDANTKFPVIDLMEEQKNIDNLGGTMRLGAYDCELKEGSKAYEAYQRKLVRERHRHRYEFNNRYRDDFEKSGMKMTGKNPQKDLVEIVEIEDHPWFVGVQFHPEYKSTVAQPHPLFVSFVKEALKHKDARTK
jgi:CTP synthase